MEQNKYVDKLLKLTKGATSQVPYGVGDKETA